MTPKIKTTPTLAAASLPANNSRREGECAAETGGVFYPTVYEPISEIQGDYYFRGARLEERHDTPGGSLVPRYGHDKAANVTTFLAGKQQVFVTLS